MAFRLGKALSEARLPWAAAAGILVVALSWALLYLAVTVYAAFLSVPARGDLSDASLNRFAGFMAAWGLPILYLLITTVAAAWLARMTGPVAPWQGITVGLFSAACLLAVGLAFGPTNPRELILYPALGAAGGYLGGVAGRSALAEREALYRASSAIAAASDAQGIAAAIGKNLSDGTEQVSLWALVSPGDGGGSPELEMLGVSPSRGPLASATRLDADRLPALVRLERLSPRVVKRHELPAGEREAWERGGVRSALLVPLGASGDGPDGLLVVHTGARRGFPWGRMRAYQTVGAQAAVALENLRLVDRARESGQLGERRRLAREIHDTLIQGFASIAMNVQAAEGSADPARANRHLGEALRTARESLAEARRIVWALRPEALEDASLPEALSSLAERWSEGGVPAEIAVTGEARRLAPETEATLLRAAQEALTNVRKHARAHRVVLTLSYMEDRVTLDVKDDGVGFEPGLAGEAGSTGGFGLGAMRERAEQSGGTVTVESEPGAARPWWSTCPPPGGPSARRRCSEERRDAGGDGPDRRRPPGREDRAARHARRGRGRRSRRGGERRRGGRGADPRLGPDVVLMDLKMPNLDGVAATARIRDRHPGAHVLVLTTSDSGADILRAIEAGATGYILKDAPREELMGAIRAASEGKSVLAPDAAAHLMQRVRWPSEEALSGREVEVLGLVAQGKSNKDIAGELWISEATVKSHLLRVYNKLGAADRASAVVAAMKRGILHP